jgi:hypothetical protein
LGSVRYIFCTVKRITYIWICAASPFATRHKIVGEYMKV